MKHILTTGRTFQWRPTTLYWLLALLLAAPLLARAHTPPADQGLVADTTELRVLRQFYYVTGGPQWTNNAGWPATPADWDIATLAQASTWTGVQVQAGDVFSLSLVANNLVGPLPPSLGQLEGLRVLALWQNRLTGPIPYQFGQLRQLRSLRVENNALTGVMPLTLGRLHNLAELYANNNRLSGQLPDSLAGCVALQVLMLANNQLSGPLPASWGQLRQLESLRASNNQLSGSLPEAWSGCTRLYGLYLDNNRLQGPLPTAWGQIRQLFQLQLSSNQLEGPIPPSWGQLTGLQVLYLNNNRLSGPLPDEMGALKSLTQLGLNYNQLTGPVAVLAQLASLQLLSLSHNKFSGPLPVGLGSLLRLQYCYADYNLLNGSLPADLAQAPLLHLQLAGNQLSGTIPANLLRHPSVSVLALQNNQFTDVEDLGGASDLTVMGNAGGNQLSFASLERLYQGPGRSRFRGAWYNPAGLDMRWQRPSPRVDTVRYQAGAAMLLSADAPGLHNYGYQWQRLVGGQWVTMPGDTLATRSVAQATAADQGTYRLVVHNRWFTNADLGPTELYSAAVYADLLPYAPLARNLPVDANQGPPMAPLTPPADVGAPRPDDINFVRVFTPRVALTQEGRVPLAPVDSVSTSTQYLDGLGRPIQMVLRQASPQRRDLVQPQAYDGLGREPRQYLPYADSVGGRGGYRYQALTDQQAFYARTGPVGGGIGPLPNDDPTRGIARTGVAFAETLFEPSPINRVAAQGAAGESWQLTSGHVQEKQERPNTALDSIPRFIPGYGPAGSTAALDPNFQGYYGNGELWGTEVADVHGPAEPDAHGYRTTEWKDELGQVILRQVEVSRVGRGTTQRSRWLRTAYAYDDFGHLRFVLQPEAMRRLLPLGDAPAPLPAAASPFVFRYRYDGRGRQIAKQIPGQDAEMLVVFDALDRPILSQDANQRSHQEWSWSKYDALGRVVLTGLVSRPDGAGRETLQAEAEQATASGQASWEQRTADAGAYPQFLTTDQAYPRLGQDGFRAGLVLSARYYDDYNFDNNAAGLADATYQVPAAGLFPAGQEPAADALRTRGLPTRSLTRVLNRPTTDPGAEWLSSTTFYDERARPVQVQSVNARGGADVVTSQFDFTGKPTRSVTTHTGPKLPAALQIIETMAYDHTGRLLSTSQQLPGEAQSVEVARVQYNELGQVLGKTLAPATPRLLQQVDYTYNIRGWLTRLNDPYFPVAGNLFNLSLHYERGFSLGYEQYNGNLTGQTWRGRGGVQRAYGYVYDPLNRLLQGDYVARAGGNMSTTGPWTAEADNFRLSFVSYDDNGNIQTLRRRGLVKGLTRFGPTQYGPVDALTYVYQGNRLQAVDDQVTTNQLPRPIGYNGAPSSAAGDFQELAGARNQAQDYAHDAVGNLTQDRNKGITGIRYNYLNLPRQLQFGTGADSVVFRYSAAGQKTAKLVYQTGKPLVRTDYLGPYQYEQDSLRFFPHAEGRVLRFVTTDPAGQALVRYQREYTLKDHLGNLRLAYRLGGVRVITASLEQDASTRQRETQQFDSLSVSPPVAQLGLARSGQYAARLNAAGPTPQPLGPLAQVAVQAGDTITVTAPGLYQQAVPHNFFFSLASWLAGLLHPVNQAPVNDRAHPALPWLQIGLAAGLTQLPQLGGGVPKGYVRVLVFGKDSSLVSQQVQQLSPAALGSYEALRLQVIAPQDGYITAYVGNESDVDVFFDDVSVEHRPGLQVQENQYDPWGLSLAGVNYSTPGIKALNQYQFNGKERQNDLGLGWSDYGARFYDPARGPVWMSTDPLADNMRRWSPYAFSFDNSLRFLDPDGRESEEVDGEKIAEEAQQGPGKPQPKPGPKPAPLQLLPKPGHAAPRDATAITYRGAAAAAMFATLKTAAQANQEFAGPPTNYSTHPIKANTPVRETATVEGDEFVRAYTEGTTSPLGRWLMRASAVRGLTPAQIQSKFALENTPTGLVRVQPHAGTPVQQSISGPAFNQPGGGVQYYLRVQQIQPEIYGEPYPITGAAVPVSPVTAMPEPISPISPMAEPMIDPMIDPIIIP